jgi:RHS repeat-associated protein
LVFIFKRSQGLGQPVALRVQVVSGSNTVLLNSSGTVRHNVRYDPWGKERWSSGLAETNYTYTGQWNDANLGLYNYNARYYDPAIGKFISADSIVPNQKRLTPLTVDFHETIFLEGVNAENRQLTFFGPFVNWSSSIKRTFGTPQGPLAPQMLNRYTYALNNPLRYIDPSGHQDIEVPNVPALTPDLDDPDWYTFTWDSPEGYIEFRIHSSDPRFSELQQLINDLKQEASDLQDAINGMNAANESSTAFYTLGVIGLIVVLASFIIALASIPTLPEGALITIGSLAIAFIGIILATISFGVGMYFDLSLSRAVRATLDREIRDLNGVLFGNDNNPGLYRIIEDISSGQ